MDFGLIQAQVKGCLSHGGMAFDFAGVTVHATIQNVGIEEVGFDGGAAARDGYRISVAGSAFTAGVPVVSSVFTAASGREYRVIQEPVYNEPVDTYEIALERIGEVVA